MILCTNCTSYLWMLAWRWSNKAKTCCHNNILILLHCCCVMVGTLKHFGFTFEFKHSGMSSIKIKLNIYIYIFQKWDLFLSSSLGQIIYSGSSSRKELFPVFVPYIANDSHALFQSLSCSVERGISTPLYFHFNFCIFSFVLQISFWQILQNPCLWLRPQYSCHIP
jgi:FtsH-binding integral membrane protein